MVQAKDNNMEGEILRKAEELFLEKGFAMTSTVEIAKAAGCNQALVHYYYRTKENLFRQIFAGKMELMIGAMMRIDGSEEDFFINLKQKIEAHYEILENNPRLPFLILNELTTNKKALKLVVDSVLKDFVFKNAYISVDEALKREIKKGTIRPITVTDLVINMVSLNVFQFLAFPILQEAFGIDEDKKQQFIAHRKQEVVTTIINGLRPLQV